jgi:uncharacterized protein (TIGR02217 family)
MSNAVFPVLPGLTWDVVKQPEFSTKVQTAASGKDATAAYWTYPRWTFKLSYELLRGGSQTELNTILGFFLARKGQFDTWLYTDPSDYIVTGQQIGIGDGSTLAFQLLRTLGGFVEPMKNINGTPVIKIGGATQTTGWSVNSSGLITFVAAPANGAIITADFSYYYRCRFLKDAAEFNQFMSDLWELKKCEFISVKS